MGDNKKEPYFIFSARAEGTQKDLPDCENKKYTIPSSFFATDNTTQRSRFLSLTTMYAVGLEPIRVLRSTRTFNT